MTEHGGDNEKDERLRLFNTGSGLKYLACSS